MDNNKDITILLQKLSLREILLDNKGFFIEPVTSFCQDILEEGNGINAKVQEKYKKDSRKGNRNKYNKYKRKILRSKYWVSLNGSKMDLLFLRTYTEKNTPG